jgi:hypothetical protein
MKHLIFAIFARVTFFSIVVIPIGIRAQQVFNATGNYYQDGNMAVSWTIGEPVIETIQKDNIVLSQGFHQPYNFYLTQILNIPQGWSGVSGYIDPVNKGLEDMFSDYVPELVILSTLTNFYYPIENTNTIGEWSYHEGYKIKTQEQFILTITGNMAIDPTVQLSSGWNLIPVLSRCGVLVTDIFGEMTNLVVAKEIGAANVFWPQFGVNTLSVLTPGKAYLVKMDSENVLTYPECSKSGDIFPAVYEPDPIVPWGAIKETGASHIVAIPSKVLHQINAQSGDVIGLFTFYEQCVGNITIGSVSKNYAIVAFADDILTNQQDGFQQGQQINVKMYRPSTAQLMDLQVEFDPLLPNAGAYAIEGLSALKKASVNDTALNIFPDRVISIYPNPSHGQFIVSMTDWPKNLHIQLYDNKGTLMKPIQPGIMQAGAKYHLNLKTLPRGVYYLKFVDHNAVEFKKIIIQ